jgi:hypothetical protein
MPEPELAKDRLSIKALAQIAHWFAFWRSVHLCCIGLQSLTCSQDCRRFALFIQPAEQSEVLAVSSSRQLSSQFQLISPQFSHVVD